MNNKSHLFIYHIAVVWGGRGIKKKHIKHVKDASTFTTTTTAFGGDQITDGTTTTTESDMLDWDNDDNGCINSDGFFVVALQFTISFFGRVLYYHHHHKNKNNNNIIESFIQEWIAIATEESSTNNNHDRTIAYHR